MSVQFRQATAEDAAAAAPLVYSSSPEMFEYVYGQENPSPLAFIEYAYKSRNGFFGYPLQTVGYEQDRNEVIFNIAHYGGDQAVRLTLQTAMLAFSFYGIWGGLRILRKTLHLSRMFIIPQHDSELLANAGVAKGFRGRGIFTACFEDIIEQVTAQGKMRIELDVNMNNPGARNLYERLGARIVDERHNKDNDPVPGVWKMIYPLDGSR